MLLHTNLQHLSWEEVQHEDVRSQMETFLCVSRDGSVKYGLNESDSWPSLQCDWVVEAFSAQLSPKLFFFFFLFTSSDYLPLSVPLFQILQALDSLFSFKWLQEIATTILQDTCLVLLSHWHNKLVPLLFSPPGCTDSDDRRLRFIKNISILFRSQPWHVSFTQWRGFFSQMVQPEQMQCQCACRGGDGG